jgi:peptidyl-prolyl cis-trans isomerase A (cyclophilin A)
VDGEFLVYEVPTMKPTPLLLATLLSLAACSKHEPEPDSHGATAASTPPAATTAAVNPGATVAPPVPAPAPSSSGPRASVLHPDLLDPSKASAKAPSVFKAKFTTTKGDFVIEVHRDWSPNGADRFYNLVKMGFYDDTRFFRAIENFMVQFGINGDPLVNARWQEAGVSDDPVKQSNKRGYVTFAQRNTPNTRTTQIFINYKDNVQLDASRFAAFGEVTQGMDIVDQLYKGYGEGAPGGRGPDQMQIQSQGNAYLDARFPQLDQIKHAEIIK